MATSEPHASKNALSLIAEAAAPSPEELETEAQVALVCRCYDEARGDEAPAALIRMLDCLLVTGSKFEGPRPTHDQTDRLMAAGNKARNPIREALGAEYPYDRMQLGLDALLGLEFHWSETPEQRAARTPHVIADLADLAAIFRNDLRNILLRRAVKERAEPRREDSIAGFHPVFREILETEILEAVGATVA